MTKPIISRKRIFDLYSNNLRYLSEKHGFRFFIESNGNNKEFVKPFYICPLCNEIFIEECLNQEIDNPLTLEDVPPRKLGGKPLILTCKKCNNSAGTKLDKALINHLNESAFIGIKSNGFVEAKVSINNSPPISSILKRGDKKEWIFQIDFKHPVFQNQIEHLKQNWDKSEINFSFNITNSDNVISALLRVGYLIAYYYFGNELLLSENINPILKQIHNPKEKILPHSGVTEININEKVEDGLHILCKPKEFKCYFPVFSLNINNNRRQFGIFIPGPGAEGWENYERIKDMRKGINLEYKVISFKDMVSNKDHSDGYSQLWRLIKSDI